MSIPASKRALAHFTAHLSLQGLAPASIATYTAAVGSYHRAHGLLDPSPQPSSKPGQERSCKVFCPPESNSETNHPQFAHLPPPPSQPVLPQDRRIFAAAFILAFHGFLRVGEYTVPSLRRLTHLIMPLFTTLSGTSTISLSPSNAPKQTNWAEAPPFPSRNHPGPVHSAPIVPSTDMSEGFPALTHALHHSFASVMAHLCLAQPAINSSAICSPKRGI